MKSSYCRSIRLYNDCCHIHCTVIFCATAENIHVVQPVGISHPNFEFDLQQWQYVQRSRRGMSHGFAERRWRELSYGRLAMG
jgi:hypothetical protein